MIKRDVIGRYKGSFIGLGWSFFNPILMLTVYTFVFSVVFQARWGTENAENKAQFSLVLFVGLIIHALVAEVLNLSPTLIQSNANYVKKVVFPLEILPIIIMGTALFHSLVSIFVLFTAFIIFNGFLHWTVVIIPLLLTPLVIFTVGIAWLLASLGVFFRDFGQAIIVLTTILLFLAPVFYPLSSLPEQYQAWIMLNPLTFIIEQSREVIIKGSTPNWSGLGIYYLVAFSVCWLGFAWFQKTRKGFADVL
jgi:lipopolysaccharide transport system permease protein